MLMKNLKEYMFIGFIFVSILGTLFHFLYDLSGNNFLVGLFTAQNESVWEHTKLLFFPMVLFSLYKKRDLTTKYPKIKDGILFGAVCGTFLIPVLFYTYSGALGYNLTAVDISIFYVCVAFAFFIAYKFTASNKHTPNQNLLNITVLILTILYIVFSIYPPKIALFVSP